MSNVSRCYRFSKFQCQQTNMMDIFFYIHHKVRWTRIRHFWLSRSTLLLYNSITIHFFLNFHNRYNEEGCIIFYLYKKRILQADHLRWPPVFDGVRVAQYWVFYVVFFIDNFCHFCPLSLTIVLSILLLFTASYMISIIWK